MLAGFTETMTVPGAVPASGVSVSHGPPEVVAVNAGDPLVVLRANFCGGGMAPPVWKVKASCGGLTVSALLPVDAPTVRVTMVV